MSGLVDSLIIIWVNMSKETERAKYMKTWNDKGYRLASPGEINLHKFLEQNPKRGSLVDFGCGTGRATLKLQKEGFDVLGVDIANNAIDTPVPFEEACIWEKPFKADWAYCCDVLEHIPPEFVEKTIENMQTKNCFIQVHLKEDKFGKRVNETLHLTIKPHSWWLEKLSKWNITHHETNGTTSIFYGEGND